MRLKTSNFPILFIFLFFISCSSIDEGAIIGTWEINHSECELSIDKKILNVFPKELSDQFGSQLSIVPTMFKEGLKEQSSSMKIKINDDGSYEPVIDYEAQIKEFYESEIQWYKDNGEEVPDYLNEEMKNELERAENRIEDDILSMLKWSIESDKLKITSFLPFGEQEDGSDISDEMRREIEENNRKAQEEAKIEVIFNIEKLNESEMLLSLDVESLIDMAKEKGLIDEAEKGLSREFGGLKLDSEKILNSLTKNIKLTLAFKKV